MPEVLVFAGTTEGRRLVEWLDARQSCRVLACAATDYGASLLAGSDRVEVLEGPLSSAQKQALMGGHSFACVVDATHPYATHISDSVAELGRTFGLDVIRVVRERGRAAGDRRFCLVEDAADYLAACEGRVLLTTGTKDLDVYVGRIPDFADRLYVRILPVAASLARTADLGIPTSHIIAMQGPFSYELNCALIRSLGITRLVTKESGAAGGFEQKVEAARSCGCELLVLERPRAEEGLLLEEACTYLEDAYGL